MEPILQLLDVLSFAHSPAPLLFRFPLGLEARGDAGLEGVAELPLHAQLRVVVGQSRVDAGDAAGGEVGSLAERAAAAAAAAAPPRRHHLAPNSTGAAGCRRGAVDAG